MNETTTTPTNRDRFLAGEKFLIKGLGWHYYKLQLTEPIKLIHRDGIPVAALTSYDDRMIYYYENGQHGTVFYSEMNFNL
ncbi:hypothetical protein HQ865_01325 [Mucilaginibacter mali]|uniref:Uncharacterized protein n=1 Tax=Mucilaginibacter mali TaxID=2740462 RepID=A0A7D4UE20_9SPHI|nr:hypothetical protein [Mucilaginibacter mali]QKJ28456.1 hypothetical protein HQ865_01325 [Mucilaginibacter mali]